MSRLKSVKPNEATGEVAEIYSNLTKASGKVIELFQGLGSSAQALNGYLHVSKLLKAGHLSAKEQEAIALVCATENGCTYCSSAHSFLAGKAGFSAEEILDLRRGKSTDPKIHSLLQFVKHMLTQHGKATDAALSQIRAAGYTDAHLAEIVLAISHNVYTNYFNNLNQTVVDFPIVKPL